MYVNYCHQCGETLSSARDPRCPKCEWLICGECGACGCSYHVAAAQAALAGVARVWAPVARPARMGLAWRRVPRAFWLLGAAGVLAAGLLVGTAILAREQAPGTEEAHATPVPVVAAVASPSSLVAVVTLEPAPASDGEAPASAEAAATAEPTTVDAQGAAGSPAVRPTTAPTRAPTAVPTYRPTPVVAKPTIPPDPALARLAIGPIPPTFGPTARATPAPTSGAVLYIANTDGLGAYLRSHPRDSEDTRLVAWREGTPMIALETQTVTGPNGPEVWVRVRDPNGQSGWIKQAYLAQRR
ncbi:MAG TPA: SH3 domain-containing protein [Chloroflexota bacterium]|nr:SH3 domain-containing protein [Chloroflexota bacterium]